MIEKLPTSPQRSTDPSTNSVRPDIGRTAAEGREAGDRANRSANDGLNRRSNDKQPGNSPYYPK